MLALMLGWGFNWPATKFALLEVPPLLLRTYTLSIGGIGLLLLAMAFGNSLGIKRKDWKSFLLMTIFTVTGWQTCMAYGIHLMPAGRASIIGNTVPIWVAFLSVWMLREKLTPFTLTGVITGAAGLAVLIAPEVAVIRAAPLGAIVMLAAAICVSIGAIFMKQHNWQTPLTVLTGWALLVGGLPIFLTAALTDQRPFVYPISTNALLGIGYNVVVATIFAQWAWFKIITLFPVTIASSVTFVVPIIAVISSAWLLDEHLGWQELTSLALVLLGLFSVLFGPSVQHRLSGR
jgi:drug/metabolite transporter (DMT)-like permease